MTRETKVGLGIAGAVFLLVGGALTYKLYFLKPAAVEISEKTTAASSVPQVVPAKSESSSMPTVSAENADKSQGETDNHPVAVTPPPPPAEPPSSNPSKPEIPPPPPTILVENKPPLPISELAKPTAPADAAPKIAETSSVHTTVPVPPVVGVASGPSQTNPAPEPQAPAPASIPPLPDKSAPANDAKPSAPPSPDKISPRPAAIVTQPGEAGNNANVPAKPPAIPPSDSTTQPSATPSVPIPPVMPQENVGGTTSASSQPGNKAERSEPVPPVPSTPSLPVVVPAPPSSEAFDRSYPVPPPPASLVARSEHKSKPDNAIPITVRPQTQPLTPPAPDAYPVKITPSTSPGSRVEVLDYEVLRYAVRTGDTWESISRQKYGSELYAAALAAYNRERDSRLAQLSVGATVLLPPAEILQRRYPHLFGGATPVGPPLTGQLGQTLPTTPMLTSKPSASSTSSNYKLYRVQPNDTMWLIAKRTLGSGERWPEIFRLNRDVIQDVNQLPPGIVLRLPADARVDNSSPPR